MIIKDVIDKDIKGLWGEEAVEGEENTPVIKTNNLSYEGVISYDDLTYRLINIEKVKKNYLQKGDLLIEKSGGTKTHSVGYVNYFDGDNDKYVCNNFILALRPNSNIIVPKYLFYNIRYLYESGNFDDCFNKTTGIQNLKTDRYLSKPIPERTIDEQEEIAKRLDLIVNVIENKRSELGLLDELVKARFIEQFGDPIQNPFEFNKMMIKDSCSVVTGNTPSRKISSYYGNYIEWIKTDNIVSYSLSPTEADEKLSEEGLKVGRFVDKNSILMACIAGSLNSIGRVCITDRKVAFNQQINAIIPEKYNVFFLYELFQMSKDYLVKDINMALKGILSKSKLEEKIFIVPPIELQNEFAEFVEKVDKSKFAYIDFSNDI